MILCSLIAWTANETRAPGCDSTGLTLSGSPLYLRAYCQAARTCKSHALKNDGKLLRLVDSFTDYLEQFLAQACSLQSVRSLSAFEKLFVETRSDPRNRCAEVSLQLRDRRFLFLNLAVCSSTLRCSLRNSLSKSRLPLRSGRCKVCPQHLPAVKLKNAFVHQVKASE